MSRSEVTKLEMCTHFDIFPDFSGRPLNFSGLKELLASHQWSVKHLNKISL